MVPLPEARIVQNGFGTLAISLWQNAIFQNPVHKTFRAPDRMTSSRQMRSTLQTFANTLLELNLLARLFD